MAKLPRRVLREAIYQREWQRYGKVPCYVCRLHVKRADASLEHMLPKALGGSNARSNLAISHRDCNSRRGHKLLVHLVGEATPTEPVMDTIQQPKITGYRQLSEAEAQLMNEAKALAEQVGGFVARLRALPSTPATGHPGTLPGDGMPYIDQRWVGIGATQLQQGFMALTRSVAQPTSF